MAQHLVQGFICLIISLCFTWNIDVMPIRLLCSVMEAHKKFEAKCYLYGIEIYSKISAACGGRITMRWWSRLSLSWSKSWYWSLQALCSYVLIGNIAGPWYDSLSVSIPMMAIFFDAMLLGYLFRIGVSCPHLGPKCMVIALEQEI